MGTDSVEMLKKVTKEPGTVKPTKCSFLKGDILTLGKSTWIKEANVVYFCATSFTPKFLTRLEKQLDRLKENSIVICASYKLKSVCFDHLQTHNVRSSFMADGGATVNAYRRNTEKPVVAKLLRGLLK